MTPLQRWAGVAVGIIGIIGGLCVLFHDWNPVSGWGP